MAEEMAAVVEAGLPLVPGLAPAGPRALAAVAADLRRQGGPALVATAAARLPGPVQGVLTAVAAGADGPRLLAALQQAAAAAQESRRRMLRAIVYPLFVGMLAVLGIGWLARRTPPLEEDTLVSRGPVVTAVPDAMPVLLAIARPAVVGVPLALAATVAWGFARGRRRSAGHADALVCEARAAVAEANGSADLAERVAADIGGAATGQRAIDRPLAAYAAARSDPLERVESLRAAAGFYRLLDERRTSRRGRLLPVIGVLAAGFLVLLYGLALFGPLAEMLEHAGGPSPATRARP